MLRKVNILLLEICDIWKIKMGKESYLLNLRHPPFPAPTSLSFCPYEKLIPSKQEIPHPHYRFVVRRISSALRFNQSVLNKINILSKMRNWFERRVNFQDGYKQWETRRMGHLNLSLAFLERRYATTERTHSISNWNPSFLVRSNARISTLARSYFNGISYIWSGRVRSFEFALA